MSLVDDKYQANLGLASIANIQIGWLQAELDSLGADQQDRREVIRQSIALLKEHANDNIVDIQAKEWGQNVSVRSGESIAQAAYGEVRTGGQITFCSADEGDSGNFLHVLVTFTCHEIDGFTKLYVDNNELTFASSIYPSGTGWSTGDYNNLIFVSCRNLGDANQVANADLVSQSAALFPGKFTSVHRQRNHAGVYFLMMYDAEKSPNGFPELAAKFKGKNDIYDPRSLATGYSNNSALCLANYLMDSRIGLGHPIDEIDLDSLAQAADDCDETINLKVGNEKRYTCNGVFSTSSSNNHQTIKKAIELSMCGKSVWACGKWYFYSGKYRAPVVNLYESDLRSGLSILAKPGKSEICNAVKGQYRGDKTGWEWADFTPITNSYYQDQDGEQLWLEQSFIFVSSSSQAQRIAKILLEMSRQWVELEASFSLQLYQAIAGDNVTLTLEWAGWASKVFRLEDLTFTPQTSDGGPYITVSGRLEETAVGVYDWNDGEETETDLAPNTNLPDPTRLPAPAGLTLASGTDQLDIRTDGTVFSRVYASWAATTNPFILTDGNWRVQYKKSTASTWRDYGLIDGTLSNCWLLDVADGQQYDVRVRGETSSGKSAWSQVLGYLVIGKLEQPSSPSNLQATTDRKGIMLTWEGITDLDLAGYEIRSGATFGGGSYVDITRSTSFLIPTQAAGSYNYTVAAKDTSKIYSDAIAVSVTILAPSAVIGLAGLVVNNMVQLTWSAPLNVSFPIKEYQIRKGSVYASAEVLGSVNATIKTIQEFTSGTYTYWVSAVDEHGNAGAETSITLVVDAPPLFTLLHDRVLDLNDYSTLTNLIIENGEIVGPINTTETLEDHYTGNSYSTPQDQIDDGYPIYAQPIVSGDGVFEIVEDFGETISAVLINLTYSHSWIDGDGDIVPTLSYSLDNSSYTSGAAGAVQVIGNNFRYVKVRFDIAGDDETSILRVTNARVRLEIKTTGDSGTVAAVSTDASGTLIDFNYTFLDVAEGSIKLLPQGSAARICGYSISGNEVRVFLFDTSGTRQSGTVSWSIDGIIASEL